MENASQALIIAGSVLIAIVLITLGVYVYVSLHNVGSMQDQKAEYEQLVNFNKKYEAYNKSLMHGTDVVTLINMAEADNEKYGTNIQISFKIEESGIFKIKVKKNGNSTEIIREQNGNFITDTYNIASYINEIKYVKGDPVFDTPERKERFDDFKRRVFICESDKTTYDNTGKISSMSFIEDKLNDYTHK